MFELMLLHVGFQDLEALIATGVLDSGFEPILPLRAYRDHGWTFIDFGIPNATAYPVSGA